MKSKLRPGDPLFYLPAKTQALLDVGCNVGSLLEQALEQGVQNVTGIELNPHAIQVAKDKFNHLTNVRLLETNASILPFDDQEFDLITCCEVLEHVPQRDRQQAVSEMNRVLQSGGRLILTVPYRGIAAGLDPANMRHRFPRTFIWISKLLGGRSRPLDEEWHHHFTLRELDLLFGDFFEKKFYRFRGGPLTPLCEILLFPFYRKQWFSHPLFKLLDRIKAWDSYWNWGRYLSYDVLIVFCKKS